LSTCELRNHCRSDPVQVQSTSGAPSLLPSKLLVCAVHCFYELPAIVPKCWAEAPIKIARMTLTIKLDGNWNSFQLANSAPPLSVTGSATAPSARMLYFRRLGLCRPGLCQEVIPANCLQVIAVSPPFPLASARNVGRSSQADCP